MLFKHKHLLEELRQTGQQASAEILSMKTEGDGGNMRALWASDEDLTTNWFDCRMTLRVVPRDRAQAPFETTVHTRIHTLKFQGGSVPVWYDPKDHTKVVVDYEADVQGTMQAVANFSLLEHRYAQQLGVAWTLVANQLLPIEVSTKPGKGQVTVAGHLGDLVRESTQTAVAYVRSDSAALLPALGADWFSRHDLHVRQAYGNLLSGGTTEDGANAAAAIAAALISILGGRMVRNDVAVTGKLTPTGVLLPVGGLKQMAAAAKHGYAVRLVAPAGDEPELHEIPERQRQGLEFVFVPTLAAMLPAVLTKHMVKGFVPPA